MGVAGRKSWTEEMQIAKRYNTLTEPFFKKLNLLLNSEDKEDNKFAIQQLNKAYVKMIPQQLTGDPEQPLVLQFDRAFKDATTSSTNKNSRKPCKV